MYVQLPLLAAICNAALPMPSRVLFNSNATASSCVSEGRLGFVVVITSCSRSVLLRRHASITSSCGAAPCCVSDGCLLRGRVVGYFVGHYDLDLCAGWMGDVGAGVGCKRGMRERLLTYGFRLLAMMFETRTFQGTADWLVLIDKKLNIVKHPLTLF